jgi:hypothetical protein
VEGESGSLRGTAAEIRRALVIVAAALSVTILASTTALAARNRAPASQAPFVNCPRQFNGTKQFPALAVSQIGARHVSCATAYRYIENFPERLRPFRCTHRFAPATDSFKYVCTDGSKAFRFTGQGE